jgi:hypothetical protein
MAGIAGATSATRDSHDDRIDRSTETQYADSVSWADVCRPRAAQAVGEVRSELASPSFHSTRVNREPPSSVPAGEECDRHGCLSETA